MVLGLRHLASCRQLRVEVSTPPSRIQTLALGALVGPGRGSARSAREPAKPSPSSCARSAPAPPGHGPCRCPRRRVGRSSGTRTARASCSTAKRAWHSSSLPHALRYRPSAACANVICLCCDARSALFAARRSVTGSLPCRDGLTLLRVPPPSPAPDVTAGYPPRPRSRRLVADDNPSALHSPRGRGRRHDAQAETGNRPHSMEPGRLEALHFERCQRAGDPWHGDPVSSTLGDSGRPTNDVTWFEWLARWTVHRITHSHHR